MGDLATRPADAGGSTRGLISRRTAGQQAGLIFNIQRSVKRGTPLVSWRIALPEYGFQVHANRLGYGCFTATQLKVIQEAVSVFAAFAFFYLKEAPTWRRSCW